MTTSFSIDLIYLLVKYSYHKDAIKNFIVDVMITRRGGGAWNDESLCPV